MRHLTRQLLLSAALLAATPLIPAPGADAGDPAPRLSADPAGKRTATAPAVAREKAGRRARSRPRFPIDGRHDYGEAAALFGASRGGRAHAGQDVFAPAGTPLVAVRDGKVVEAGNDGGRGNYVAIHAAGPGQTYVYLHMLEHAKVRVGDRVRAGQRVGMVGCSGSCWGDHLHFEIRQGEGPYGAAHDPLPALRRWDRR